MYLTNYKGKHFVITDDPDETTFKEITKEEVMDENFVALHKEMCDYYGIPPYIGDDKELKQIYNKYPMQC